jgi:hypothetical protein
MFKPKNVFSFNAAVCLLFVLLLIMSGCAPTLSPTAANIKQVSKEIVSECKYLGKVTGSSQVGGQVAVAYHSGKDRAEGDALEKAAQLGATHIVWRQLTDGTPVVAIGDVYLCGETKK